MKPIRVALWGLLLGLSLLWVATDLPLHQPRDIAAVRQLLLQYSGVLSIGAMSVAMILCVRSPWADRWLNGLDKSYRLHKWLGIAALATAVVHWVAANGLRWAVTWGLMDRPDRHGPRGGPHVTGAVQAFLDSQRHTAVVVGEWAFYAAVALIAVALIKRIPYRFFAATHTLIAAAYLAFVLHAVVLMKFDAWTHPVGIITALLMIGGVVSAVMALTRRIGVRRRVAGRVTAVRQFRSMKITEAEIALDDRWPGHEAGQFAFVTFNRREGAHPFTIASAWNPSTRSITFISKALGDFTALLPELLKIGDDVTVEGPYGRFNFDDKKERQIWIGAGIGITPFIARLKQLASTPDGKQIDLIHAVSEIAPEPKAKLEADVVRAGATLHLMHSREDGLLTGARLREMLPDFSMASIWFCGPAAFGETLRRDLMAHGLRPSDFHQELFDMR